MVLLISFLVNTDQPTLYKQILNNNSTYDKIADDIKGVNSKIIRNSVENNIDSTIKWLNGKQKDLELEPIVGEKLASNNFDINLNTYRDYFVRLKSIIPIIFLFGVALFLLNLIFLAASNTPFWKNLSKQLRILTWHSLILSIIFLLLVNTFLFNSNWFKQLIFGNLLNNITNLNFDSNWLMLNFSFQWLFWIWIFISVCFSLSVFCWLMNNSFKRGNKNQIKLNSKTKQSKHYGSDTLIVEQETVRQRVKKYHQKKIFDNNFDSNITNFSIPNGNNDFSYDAIELKNLQAKIKQKIN
jgi:hypothetical protein